MLSIFKLNYKPWWNLSFYPISKQNNLIWLIRLNLVAILWQSKIFAECLILVFTRLIYLIIWIYLLPIFVMNDVLISDECLLNAIQVCLQYITLNLLGWNMGFSIAYFSQVINLQVCDKQDNLMISLIRHFWKWLHYH